MAKKIGVRTITVVRKPRGNWLETGPAAAEARHDITGCVILPRSSYEAERGWVIVDGRQIIAPYGSDVVATDQVEIDGELWDVDGAPGDYENRRGAPKATMFYLKSVS